MFVAVLTGQKQRCGGHIAAPLPSGFISNQVTMETGLGSVSCPWRITGGPGQRITITLLDFGVWRSEGDQGT